MKNNNVVSLKQPEESSVDVLTELLRNGAKDLIRQAVEAELEELLNESRHLQFNGKQAVVRNGYLPERTIQTGLGDVEVKIPKVRDKRKQGIKFNSLLIPPYLKRTESIEELLPVLYLKGISTGDFSEALKALLGPQAIKGSRPGRSVVLNSSGRKSIKAGQEGVLH